MKAAAPARRIYGLMAEFHAPRDVVEAAHARARGGLPARWTPTRRIPIEELAEALGFHHSPLPLLVLPGGIVGLLGGYGLQYWAAVIEYPMNIGGRPVHSWPAFIVARLRDHDPVRGAHGGARACWP